jgi:HAMP domain-containing protein
MSKLVYSLQFKLIASFVILILFVSCATFLYTYNETKNAMLNSTKDDMANSIGMIAQQFTSQDAQTMYQLQSGQENTTAFTALKEKMQIIRAKSPNIVNIYTMHLENDGKVTFIVDDLEEGAAAIGEQYKQPEPKLFTAVNGITTSDNIYTDEWGSFLSGYAPLNDAQGHIVIIAADMDATTVIQRENFIGNTIYLIVGTSIAVAAAIVGYLSITMIRDIKKLNKTAEEISKGNMDVTVDVNRKDEVGDLAESFGRMVASLKFMMSEQEQSDKQ